MPQKLKKGGRLGLAFRQGIELARSATVGVDQGQVGVKKKMAERRGEVGDRQLVFKGGWVGRWEGGEWAKPAF